MPSADMNITTEGPDQLVKSAALTIRLWRYDGRILRGPRLLIVGQVGALVSLCHVGLHISHPAQILDHLGHDHIVGHVVIITGGLPDGGQELKLEVMVWLIGDDVAQWHATPAWLGQQCQVPLHTPHMS